MRYPTIYHCFLLLGQVGPFRLGTPLILVCLVEGGDPEPAVVWWRDGQPFDEVPDPGTYEGVLQVRFVTQRRQLIYCLRRA